jgi:hypothetical protein
MKEADDYGSLLGGYCSKMIMFMGGTEGASPLCERSEPTIRDLVRFSVIKGAAE